MAPAALLISATEGLDPEKVEDPLVLGIPDQMVQQRGGHSVNQPGCSGSAGMKDVPCGRLPPNAMAPVVAEPTEMGLIPQGVELQDEFLLDGRSRRGCRSSLVSPRRGAPSARRLSG